MFRLNILFLSAVFAAVLSAPAVATTPIPLNEYQDLDNKALTLEQLRNKVTVLIVANRATADAATAVGDQIRLDLSGEPRLLYVAVLNLRDIPSFARGLVTGLIRDQARTAEASLQARFTQTNKDPEKASPKPPLLVPDWNGSLALKLWQESPLAEFAVFKDDSRRAGRYEREKVQRVQQQLENRVHVFVLDAQGQVQAHYLDAGAASLTTAKVRALLKESRAQL